MTEIAKRPALDLTFPHRWRVEVLSGRPLILPPRHYTYPREVEEVERGALELMIHPNGAESELVPTEHLPGPVLPITSLPFLATCALGFRDPAVPTGVWSTPHPDILCAVAGGYAYLIDTTAPEHFTMLPYRPVLEVRQAPEAGVLLFVGHHSILAWGSSPLDGGPAWESEKLSDEGVFVDRIEKNILHGRGWQMMTDKETAFRLDLRTGRA